MHADPSRGGAERYTVDLASALRGRGHEVALLASGFPGGSPPAGGVLIEARGATRARSYGDFLDQLDAHLEAARYDIVHAMLPVRRCDVYHPHAGIAAEAVRSGHLKHDTALPRMLSRAATRLNARRQKFAAVERTLLTGPNPPLVLCLSQYVKSIVRQNYVLPDTKLASLFNAVDLQKFDPERRPQAGGVWPDSVAHDSQTSKAAFRYPVPPVPPPADSFLSTAPAGDGTGGTGGHKIWPHPAGGEIRRRFDIGPDKSVGLMIAQDFARKGLRQTLQAVATLGDPRLVLLVVGRQDAGAYRQLAAKLGVADRVIFAGATDDPYAFYRAADFFVLPTRNDPCSLAVLESLAMGLPVISTALNGACEIMSDGEQGFVLDDPGDINALASAMRRLMDPDRRSAMARACLALRPKLAYSHHLDELLRLYEFASARTVVS